MKKYSNYNLDIFNNHSGIVIFKGGRGNKQANKEDRNLFLKLHLSAEYGKLAQEKSK